MAELSDFTGLDQVLPYLQEKGVLATPRAIRRILVSLARAGRFDLLDSPGAQFQAESQKSYGKFQHFLATRFDQLRAKHAEAQAQAQVQEQVDGSATTAAPAVGL